VHKYPTTELIPVILFNICVAFLAKILGEFSEEGDAHHFIWKIPWDTPKSSGQVCCEILEAFEGTDADRSKSNEVGIAWCDDGRHFIANSESPSKHLCLRPDSINANFDDIGFVLRRAPLNHITASFGNLADPRHWKRRIHANGVFRKGLTAIEMACISLSKNGIWDQSLFPNLSSSWILFQI
jgi:hypothetical protein